MTVFQSAESKNVFAGYTSKPWTSNEQRVADEKAMLFSVDNVAINYSCVDPKNAIKHSQDSGPNFGLDALVLNKD